MTNYPEGSLVTVRGRFTNSSGTAHNPTAVFLDVTEPSGAQVTYTYGVDAIVTNPIVGTFEANLDSTGKRELWLYTFWSTGAGQSDSGERSFYIE